MFSLLRALLALLSLLLPILLIFISAGLWLRVLLWPSSALSSPFGSFSFGCFLSLVAGAWGPAAALLGHRIPLIVHRRRRLPLAVSLGRPAAAGPQAPATRLRKHPKLKL